MATIKQNNDCWELEGELVMDDANRVLVNSRGLTLADNASVDFSKVSEVDTSAVSLMLEWRRRAIAEKKQLSFINFPEGLTSLVALYGVESLIG